MFSQIYQRADPAARPKRTRIVLHVHQARHESHCQVSSSALSLPETIASHDSFRRQRHELIFPICQCCESTHDVRLDKHP